MIDPKTPSIAINKNDKGAYVVTVYGAVAHWPKCNSPEPKMSQDKSTQLVKVDKDTRRPVLKDGKEQLLWSWGVQLVVPKSTPGAEELLAACMEIRKTDSRLKGQGKVSAIKDGDKVADANIAEGKDPAWQEWLRGNWLITANSIGTIDRPPRVRNEIYAGAVCVAVIQLGAFEVPGNKGVKAYLQEIGRVAAGTRIEFGRAASVLEGVVEFEEDKSEAPTAPEPSTGAPAAAGTDGMPWED